MRGHASIQVAHEDDAVLACTAGNLFAMAPYGQARAEHADIICDCMTQTMASSGTAIGVAMIIRSGSSPPDDYMRERIRQYVRTHGDDICAMAIIILGSGFFAGTFLAVASKFSTAIRPTYPRMVSRSLADAAPWLAARARRPGFEHEPSEVLELLAHVEAVYAGGRRRAG